MLAWPLEAARESDCFERIIVSTDDEEIADIARLYGADVPFMRPARLADDFTGADHAARHALEWVMNNIGPVQAFCHLYPTSPLLSPDTIREGMKIVHGTQFKAAWTMVHIPYPVYQLMIQGKDGRLKRLFPNKLAEQRSQDMPQAMIDSGHMYCFETSFFLRNGLTVGPQVFPLFVPMEAAIDIDTEADWIRAERLAVLNGFPIR